MAGAIERRYQKHKSPREGTVTHHIWHRFVSNIGVQIDVLTMAKELGVKDIHSAIGTINNNYRLNIMRCGTGLYILEEL